MSEQITISIVDDHPLVIGGMVKLLNNYEHLCLTGIYNSGQELLQGLKENRCEILLLDIQMPQLNGISLMDTLKTNYKEVKVIALTAHDTPYYIQTMLSKGCLGYILKNSSEEEIIEAIETVHKGQQYLARSIREELLFDLVKMNSKGVTLKGKLTSREIDILRLIVAEYTSQEIAEHLYLSHRTVEKYRLNLLQKLDVKNTAGLVKAALQHNLLADNE